MSSSRIRVVCLGDSLAICGGPGGSFVDWLAAWLPECEFINQSAGGETIAGGRSRFAHDVLALDPDLVIIQLGANDFWLADAPLAALEAALEEMIVASRRRGAEVLLAGVFGDMAAPSGEKIPKHVAFPELSGDFGQEILALERKLAQKHHCWHVENLQADLWDRSARYWEDFNHPNKQGNELVAKRLLPPLKQALEKIKQRQAQPRK